MERKLSIRQLKTVIFGSLFFPAGFFCLAGACLAATPAPTREVYQIEAKVIQVDQYGVYVPKHVFYFDTQMDKQKTALLAKAAEQLRNKQAIITYSSTGDLSPGNRALLLDIVSAQEAGSSKKPQREASEQAGSTQDLQPRKLSIMEAGAPKETEPAGEQRPPKPTAVQEKKPSGPPAKSGPISKDEVRAFVLNLLELNEKKDLPAVMAFYADNVDYYDRGVVDRDYLKRDLGYYFRNWAQINTRLDGDVVMIALDQPEVRIAKFVSSYSVKNDKKSLAGKTENIWKIQRLNGQLKLIDVKQRTLGKE